MITDEKLDFWIKNNYNVLFIGEHGVGKTARIKEAFEKAKLKWLYFSASTLDPWVDFIGIPKEAVDAKGNKYIDLIRPKAFADDEVEAIFLDEFNRSSTKIRNAVMELIQFKSINGKKFNNLKVIWAAINPENEKDEENKYDVEKLDPAQKDRFQIHVHVPYKPDKTYFTQKYGTDLARNSIDWWTKLNAKEQESISPRRLDYILDTYIKNGDVRDLVPKTINMTKFMNTMKNGSYLSHMKDIISSGDKSKISAFISNRNAFDETIDTIVSSDKLIETFIPYVKDEDFTNLLAKNKKVYNYVTSNADKFTNQIQNIIKAKNMPKLCNKLKKDEKLKNIDTCGIAEEVKKLTFKNFNTHKGLKKVHKLTSNCWRDIQCEIQAVGSRAGFAQLVSYIDRNYYKISPARVKNILKLFGILIDYNKKNIHSEEFKYYFGLMAALMQKHHPGTTIKDIFLLLNKCGGFGSNKIPLEDKINGFLKSYVALYE